MTRVPWARYADDLTEEYDLKKENINLLSTSPIGRRGYAYRDSFASRGQDVSGLIKKEVGENTSTGCHDTHLEVDWASFEMPKAQ